MNLSQIFGRARDFYVEQFQAFVDDQRARLKTGVAEQKVGGNEGAYEGFLRMDFATDDAVVAFAGDRYLSFTPFTVSLTTAVLAVEHVQWGDVVVLHDAADLPPEEIDYWFQTWFDPDGSRDPDLLDVSGYIHFLSLEDGRMDIDFGTAGSDALLDIIGLLERAGAQTIFVTDSSSASEPED